MRINISLQGEAENEENILFHIIFTHIVFIILFLHFLVQYDVWSCQIITIFA